MENKYRVIVGMRGYLPQYTADCATLNDVKSELAHVRELWNDLGGLWNSQNWRNDVVTPVRKIRAGDMIPYGIVYLLNMDYYCEIHAIEEEQAS